MFKTTLELGRVNKYLKLKFSLVIKSDNYMPLINKFNIGGNDYLKISPIPLITLEIKSNVDKKEDWNPNKSLCFSKSTKFIFCKRLDEIIKGFKEELNLFFYEGDTLKVNKELSSKLKEMVRVGTKVVLFQPIVVEDDETKDLFEGVVMMINSPENYCMLTFEELEYLSEYLHSLDLDSLSLQVINTTIACNGMKTEKLQQAKHLATEPEHEEIHQEPSRLVMTNKGTIPEI